ncbi:hypothetical protein K458DRAFT_368159 [Lentithecium fluviatile CBS 122367]|uniref:N-acetyltransferase domain-containing protein n=1 Tax=Lentithecium fluviatile CBS 122367 TaxID=1168545 RepID=A0A6G1J0N8_9PLEO|nr:hypothetical protein K458DRAFT_368159 [Lentithecium fluviatile CBS 122367]
MKPLGSHESDGGIDFISNSNGDPHYDVAKLMDWNGDWLPPPVEWSARHRFTNRHLGNSVEKWITEHDMSCTQDISEHLKSLDFLVITKDLVPRTWVPLKIEGDSPQQFWRALPSRAPPALSDIDLSEREPYWHGYPEDTNSCFLAPPEVPTALLDPEDGENKKPKAAMSCNGALEFIKHKRTKREQKAEQRRSRPVPSGPVRPLIPQLQPTANIYLRPVMPADAPGIRELYNYYVAETISAPEFNPRRIDHIVQRIDDVTSEKLPYIVAIAKGNQPRSSDHFVTERIVGFASIEDFCDKGSVYRFTFELELYVHPGYVRKGIAKCLLDRLLSTVSTGYQLKGGYEWINRGEYLKGDAGRVVKTINVSVPHEETDDMVWVSKFLKEFKFNKSGHLKRMGAKKGKIVDVTIYQHTTSEIIDPSVPPVNPL